MNILTAWISAILSVIILGITADLLLSGRLKNFCRSVFATVAVLVVVMPIPAVFKSGCKSVDEIFVASIHLDEEYISAGIEYIENRFDRAIETSLKSDGIKGVTVETTLKEGSYTEIQTIKLYLKNFVIDKELLHINKYEYLRKKVTEYSGIEEEMIFIYE